MTIASPSRLVVADIKWLLREFQRFPPMAHKNFWKKNYMQLGSQRHCDAVMLSRALQRNAKHEARLSNISV
jgi:hypothetical protein